MNIGNNTHQKLNYNRILGIESLLEKADFNIHHTSLEEFASWLQSQDDSLQKNEVYATRSTIRNIKRSHIVEWKRLNNLCQTLEESWNNHSLKVQYDTIVQRQNNIVKALHGLRATWNTTHQEKTLSKIQLLEEESHTLSKQFIDIDSQCQIKHDLDQVQKQIQDFRHELGLDKLESKLKYLLQQQGQSYNNNGISFEDLSYNLIQNYIYPQININMLSQDHWCILRQVKLGCARAEWDYVVVEQQDNTKPVHILALIEVKRNANDIVHGFEVRQENIAWATQDSQGFSKELYKTKVFQDGIFSKAVVHIENGIEYLFSTESFKNFHRANNGYYMDHLFFITRIKKLLGMTNSEYQKIFYRLSTDYELDLHNEIELMNFWNWCKNIVSKIQTKDILQLYANNEQWKKQIIICDY